MTKDQSDRIFQAAQKANAAAKRATGQKLFEPQRTFDATQYKSVSLGLAVLDLPLGSTREVSDGDQVVEAIIETVERAKGQLDRLITELRKEL